MAAGYDGSIRINTKLNTNGFLSGINSMTASLGKLASAVGVAFSVTALVKMGRQSIELASDIAEVDNVVSKSFGSMRSEMDALADSAIQNLGMSSLTAYQTGSTFMAMGKSMLDSAEDAKDMALELTKLTGNMSSFYNVRHDIANTALKSIYTGETETLKQFGVVMTETNMQQFAFEQGIQKKISAMTQSEKVMLRYKYVTEQLSFIGNDFIDTQDSWANQTKILSEQWKELLIILGNGLITVLTPVVKGLNAIVAAMINVANTIGQIMSKIFGIEAQEFGATEVEDAYSDIAGSAGDAADATDEYGNAVDKAGKKAKGALASFDKLNVLQQDNSGSSNAGGIGGGITTKPIEDGNSIIDDAKNELNDFEKRLLELKNLFKEGFDNGFKSDKLEEIYENLKRIGAAASKIWNNPEVQQSFNDFINQTTVMLGTIAGASASIGVSLADGITGGMAQAFEDENFQQFATTKLSSIFDNLTLGEEHITEFAEALATIATAFESDAFKGIVDFFTQIGAVAGLETLDIITGFLTDLIGLTTKPVSENADKWKELLENILEMTNNLLEPAKQLLSLIEGNSSKYQNSAIHKFMEKMTGDDVASVGKALDGINGVLDRFNAKVNKTNIDKGIENIKNFGQHFTEMKESLEESEIGSILLDMFEGDWASVFAESGDIVEASLDGIETWFDEKSDMVQRWFEENVQPWFNAEKWDEVLFNIGASLGYAIADFKETWTEDIPEWFESDVKPWFTIEKWQEVLGGIKDGFATKWDETKTAWDESVGAWWEESVAPWFSIDTWLELLTGFKDGVSESVTEMIEAWDSTMSAWWEDSVSPWFTLEKWKQLGTDIKKGLYDGFKGIANGVIGILNNIVDGFEGMANKIIDGINKIIDGYNSVAPHLGFDMWNPIPPLDLTPLKIPKLANGAVIPPNSQFLAILGDQTRGMNIEAPAGLIKDMVKEALAENGGVGGGECTIILELSGREIHREVVRQEQMFKKSTGISSFA